MAHTESPDSRPVISRALQRYIIAETGVSLAINVALAAIFVTLIFGGHEAIPLWGAHGIAIDYFPQTFMGSLMSIVVPTLLTRRRIRVGKLPVHGVIANTFWARHPVLRSVALAAASTTILGGIAVLVTAALWTAPLGFHQALLLKLIYASLIALIATPTGLALALADLTAKSPS